MNNSKQPVIRTKILPRLQDYSQMSLRKRLLGMNRHRAQMAIKLSGMTVHLKNKQ
jgi:hypothetical protein